MRNNYVVKIFYGHGKEFDRIVLTEEAVQKIIKDVLRITPNFTYAIEHNGRSET